MRAFIALVLFLVSLALVGVSTNYYLWHKQTERIRDVVSKASERAEKAGDKLSFDKIEFNGYKCWDVQGQISNLKIAVNGIKSGGINFNNVKFESKLGEGIFTLTFDNEIDADLPQYNTQKLSYKIKFPKEPMQFNFYYTSAYWAILNNSDHVDMERIIKSMHGFKISDGGASIVDKEKNIEVSSTSGEFFELNYDINSDLKQVEFKLGYKDHFLFDDNHKVLTGPDVLNMDVLVEGQVANDKISTWQPEDVQSYKVHIKDFTVGNEIGKAQLLGTLKGDKTSFYLPSVSLDFMIFNFNEFIDIIKQKISTPISTSDPELKAELEVLKDVDFDKIKKYFSQYLVNDKDLKIEISGTNINDLKIGGKPFMVFENELDAVLAPPAPILPAPQPGTVMPNATPAPVAPVQTQSIPEINGGTAAPAPVIPPATPVAPVTK